MPVINVIVPGPVTSPEEGPCSWPLETTCVPDWETLPLDVQEAASAWAVYILWALTGRQYGPCSVIVRPCGPRCDGPFGYMTFPVHGGGHSGALGQWMTPWIDNGVWRNCGCAGACTCAARCEVPLPGPVAVIDQVKVDGIVVPPAAYRLDTVRGIPVLVRTDGECWPECQDMNVSPDDIGSFSIQYQRGVAVPRAGSIAAGKLAGEFAKACAGADCTLPQQLASLSRNGVEVQMVDPAQILEGGLTGIADVDLFIRAVNPYRRSQPSRVYSADRPEPRFVQ